MPKKFVLDDAKEVVTQDMFDWMKAEDKKSPELHLARCLACVIHSRDCYYNHTDGCGWFYNAKDSEFSRGKYLKRAKAAIDKHGREWAKDVVGAFVAAEKAKQAVSKLFDGKKV